MLNKEDYKMLTYKNEGETIRFDYADVLGKPVCDIIATYLPSRTDRDKFTVKLELRKYIDTPYEKQQEFKHLIATQDISSTKVTIKSDIARVVDMMIKSKTIDAYVRDFSNGIALTIEWMKEIA
jgi:hypothetical protein